MPISMLSQSVKEPSALSCFYFNLNDHFQVSAYQARNIQRAAHKVEAWKQFNVIFMADQIPKERQYALIVVVV